MNFIYKFFARLTHPYNRPELAGNMTILLLAFIYLSVSIITTKPKKAESKETGRSDFNSSLVFHKTIHG